EAKEKLDDPDMKANGHKLTSYAVPSADGSQADPAYVFPTYEWFQACAAAALGDYDDADAVLEKVGGRAAAETDLTRAEYAKSLPVLLASELGALAQARVAALPVLWGLNRDMQVRLLFLRSQQADLLLLRGLLDL